MWIMCPVAWPTAKLLDYLLGEDHGTLYKKAGLKTLVQLHKTLPSADQLMQDEVTIISSVLDLKDKPVEEVMTPMQDVFTMSADTVLDEKMMDIILSQGYSRIPIHVPDNEQNFIGMLLVKILIPYDPEDCLRVRDFALATLPETKPNTSCLDILNYFQEGKSHMVLVSEYPGTSKGALGVITLEDVIEELIGEEIIDESDVFVDVHKAIRRIAPAPKSKFGRYGHDQTHSDREGDGKDAGEDSPLLAPHKPDPPRKTMQTTFLMRRRSSAASDSTHTTLKPVAVRGNTTDMKQHLKHLGPSNAASRPKTTKFSAVKIKPGAAIDDAADRKSSTIDSETLSQHASLDVRDHEPEVLQEGGVNHADASDGAVALHIQSGYGTMENVPSADTIPASEASKKAKENTEVESPTGHAPLVHSNSMSAVEGSGTAQAGASSLYSLKQPDRLVGSTGDLNSAGDRITPVRRKARSGSITETMVESGGIRKYVLETTSSSSEEAEDESPVARATENGATAVFSDGEPSTGDNSRVEGGELVNGKKRRKKRGKRKKGDSPTEE
jgi:metal transporter CNNM